jgi:hypothetical protein
MKKTRSSVNSGEFQALWHELRAISFWDKAYRRMAYMLLSKTAAWLACRRRMREIAMRILALNRLTAEDNL